MSEPTKTAKVIKKFYLENKSKLSDKPIFASWMGGKIVVKGKQILSSSGIPCFDYPDVAVAVFNKLWKYNEDIKELHNYPETSEIIGDELKFEFNHDLKLKAIKFIENIIKNNPNRTENVLTEFESKNLLKMYDIPSTETIIASTEEEAAQSAKKIGFPVVIKIHSETITHKTDVGGVKLNLQNENEVKKAFNEIKESLIKIDKIKDFLGVTVQPMIKLSDSYEVIVGSKIDVQTGPIILFGQGGSLVELIKDTAIEIPPLTKLLSRKLINSTKISKALKGYRNKGAVNLDGLETILCKFSQLVVDLRVFVKEIDINPLLLSTVNKNIIALDARIVYYPENYDKSKIQIPAIRPYPRRHVIPLLKVVNDYEIVFRPTHIEDHPFISKFFKKIADVVNNNPKTILSFQYAEAFLKLMRQQEHQFFKENLIKDEKKLMNVESQRANDLFIRMCMGNTDKEVCIIAVPKRFNFFITFYFF
jgi:acetyltransferase